MTMEAHGGNSDCLRMSFDKKSLESYKGKPIIITHDAGEVDKENVRREQIGTIMSEGYRDGDSVRCEIIIHDTNALKSCGLKELSLGYSLDTDDTREYITERNTIVFRKISKSIILHLSEKQEREKLLA